MNGGGSLEYDIRRTPHPVSPEERAALLTDPGFGRVFTDHMATIRYAEGKGWYDARIEPFGPIPLSPATSALHYAQEIFEGLKAYRLPDGGAVLFRPEVNARRFRDSARRMAMPELPEELFLDSLRVLVRHEGDWLPEDPEASLYLRPLMFATEAFLGVRPANEYLYVLMASPAGSYFASGVKPVRLWISRHYIRAAPGGTGYAKAAGNYGASLLAQREAIDAGCEQVVFLDAAQRRWVEELGGMNVFFCYADELVTPPLTDTILPGVTRDAVITLARHLGHRVTERPYSIDEWRADAASGRLREVFACGTAAVITPVGVVRDPDGEIVAGDGEPGAVTMDLRQRLLDLQHGRAEDRFGWLHRL